MDTVEFSRPLPSLCCIIGNLFSGLEPPCRDDRRGDCFTVCGTTHSGKFARVAVYKDRCVFEGDREDLNEVLAHQCPEERRCVYGR